MLVGEVRLFSRDGALIDLARRAVDRDHVAFAHHLVAPIDGEGALLVVHTDALAADDRGQAQPARDDGGVAARAATTGENALGDEHAVDVVGAGLLAHEDNRLAGLASGLGAVSVEDRLADGGARRGVDAPRQKAARRAGRFLPAPG